MLPNAPASDGALKIGRDLPIAWKKCGIRN
jgi:hypothetical protein